MGKIKAKRPLVVRQKFPADVNSQRTLDSSKSNTAKFHAPPNENDTPQQPYPKKSKTNANCSNPATRGKIVSSRLEDVAEPIYLFERIIFPCDANAFKNTYFEKQPFLAKVSSTMDEKQKTEKTEKNSLILAAPKLKGGDDTAAETDDHTNRFRTMASSKEIRSLLDSLTLGLDFTLTKVHSDNGLRETLNHHALVDLLKKRKKKKKGHRRSDNQGTDSTDRINDLIWDLYSNYGWSIRILRPQAHIDAVWSICSKLQDFFAAGVSANIYLTPPGSQGFAPHFDDIDAFVCQIEGSKHWRVYAPVASNSSFVSPPSGFQVSRKAINALTVEEDPTLSVNPQREVNYTDNGLSLLSDAAPESKNHRTQRSIPLLPRYSSRDFHNDELQVVWGLKPVIDTVLYPGDMLYLPRGFIHQADCPSAKSVEKTPSIHATLSVHQRWTWADLLIQAMPQMVERAARKSPILRTTVPSDWISRHGSFVLQAHDRQAPSMFETQWKSIWKELGSMISLDVLSDSLGIRFMTERLPPRNEVDLEALQQQIDTVSDKTKVRLVQRDIIRLVYDENDVIPCVALYHCVENERNIHDDVEQMPTGLGENGAEEGEQGRVDSDENQDRNSMADDDASASAGSNLNEKAVKPIHIEEPADDFENGMLKLTPEEGVAVDFIIQNYPQWTTVKKIPLAENSDRVDLVKALLDLGVVEVEK